MSVCTCFFHLLHLVLLLSKIRLGTKMEVKSMHVVCTLYLMSGIP
jgi:hypothetical protein